MNEILEIPRIYTAFAEWGACMVYVLMLKKKFSRSATVIFSALSLLLLGAFMHFTGELPIVWWFPCMITAVLWMIFTIDPETQTSRADSNEHR